MTDLALPGVSTIIYIINSCCKNTIEYTAIVSNIVHMPGAIFAHRAEIYENYPVVT